MGRAPSCRTARIKTKTDTGRYQYKRGSQAVLDTLERYNKENIQNLETIIEMLYPSLMENAYQLIEF